MQSVSTLITIGIAACGIWLGLTLLFRPDLAKKDAEAKYERQLADRHRRGSDAYLDELRALEAYKPKTPLWAYRLIGLLLLFSCGGMIAVKYFKF
jgi:hypothetical protein